MKKLIIGLLMLAAGSYIFVSCEKTSSVPDPVTPTTHACTDSAWLLADTLYSCFGKSVLQIRGNNKLIVSNNAITAIDTIAGNASFYITYDSIGTIACGGAVLTKANITCYQRY